MAKYKTRNGKIVKTEDPPKEGEVLKRKTRSSEELYASIDAAVALSNIADLDEQYAYIDDLMERLAKGELSENVSMGLMLKRLPIIDRRMNTQFRLLAKALPDLRSVEHSGSLNNATSMDDLPDELLAEIAAGRINEERIAHLEQYVMGADGSETKH